MADVGLRPDGRHNTQLHFAVKYQAILFIFRKSWLQVSTTEAFVATVISPEN
jgi:hypothetical protein